MDIKRIYEILSIYNLDDDTKQELAIKIWLASNSFNKEKGNLEAWVSTIVKNYKIDYSRTRDYKEGKITNTLSNYELVNDNGEIYSIIEHLITSKDISPEKQLILSQEKEEVLKLIKTTLNDKQARIFLLLSEGYKHKEIAGILNLTVTCVKSNISRARVKMKKTLLKS